MAEVTIVTSAIKNGTLSIVMYIQVYEFCGIIVFARSNQFQRNY